MKILVFLKSLKGKSLREIFFIGKEILVNTHGEIVARLTGRIYLSSLAIITNFNCNLRCKDCSNFIPYLPNKRIHSFSLEELKPDLDILFSMLILRKVVIQGGECFLNKDLCHIISYIGERAKTRKIHISTNGTLLMTDDLMKTCRKYNVTVRLSDYGLPQQRINNLLYQGKKHGVDVWVRLTRNRKPEVESWFDMGINLPKNYDSEEVQHIYDTCIFKRCYTLADGFLTKCPRAPMGHLVGFHHYFPDDLIDVQNDSNIRERIKKLKGDRFMEACRYCNGVTGRKIKPGEQIGK